MASSDFAQKLLHDLRLRKQRMANTQNSDMYHNSRQNFKGSRETRTLEVSRKAGTGSRYRSSSNTQKTPANPQSANQIVPYGGGHQSRQVSDLSMALNYAFDNRGKLKRLDIASNGPMMNLLQQIGRTSTQQRLDIQWQSTNQFPNLTNLHINEISKGAQKLNQLLRACSSGFNINKDSIEIGKELWKGAMELEQSLRMLVSLQEVSSDNTVNPQRKSRLRLLDDNGDSEDDSTESSEKPKQVERPVFSFDKPSKNTKVTVQKLTIQPQLKDQSPNAERQMSITTTSTPHRRSASCGSELNTDQFTNSSTSKHNAARLPSVIAKLMGLEELPQNSNQKAAAERSVSQQRTRDSIVSHTAQRSSKKVDLKTEYTRPDKNPVNQIRVQSNKITILASQKIELQDDTYRTTKNHNTTLDRENPNWKLEERHAIKNYVQESKTAISKINELQTKNMNLKEDSKTQNDVIKEANFKSIKQKQEAAKEISQGKTPPRNRSSKEAETTQVDTQGNSDNQEIQKAETSNIQLTQQKQYQDVKLQKISTSYQPHGKSSNEAENRNQPKANHRTELRKRDRNAEKVKSSRIITRDVKILQKQLPARQENVGMKSREYPKLAASKALLRNEKNEEPEEVSTNINDGRKNSISLKSESEMAEVRTSSYMQARSEQRELGDTKPPKTRPTVKANKEIRKVVTVPRRVERALKPHKATSSENIKQNQRHRISVSRAATIANESIMKSKESTSGKDESRNTTSCEKSQQKEDEDNDQLYSRNHTVREELLQQQQETIRVTPGDTGKESISNIDDDRQEVVTNEVRVKPQVISTDGLEGCIVNYSQQQKQQNSIKVEKQEPLTEDEMFLKQKLILSHLFLNTAEALFKLNIPISILNYASDQICEERNCKIILDCGYELLKRKGRRKEANVYPSINISMSYTRIMSLDDLVRQLHKDFEALRYYGRNEKDDYDYANCILKMLESDIYNKHPDLNSMWDLGWNEEMFPCANTEEIICNIEELMLDELMNEFTNDYM